MKRLNIVFFISVFAATAVFATSLYAAPYAKPNQFAQADTQNTPKMPQSMMPGRSPMQNSGADESQGDESLSIMEFISQNQSLSTLAKAIKSADLISTLSDPGPITLFAPNDAAFAKMSPNTLSDLLSPENKDKLVAILTFHVVPGELTTDNLKSGKIKTLQGKALNVKVSGHNVSVNNANVSKPDIAASNGVVHVIDTVLIP